MYVHNNRHSKITIGDMNVCIMILRRSYMHQNSSTSNTQIHTVYYTYCTDRGSLHRLIFKVSIKVFNTYLIGF